MEDIYKLEMNKQRHCDHLHFKKSLDLVYWLIILLKHVDENDFI